MLQETLNSLFSAISESGGKCYKGLLPVNKCTKNCKFERGHDPGQLNFKLRTWLFEISKNLWYHFFKCPQWALLVLQLWELLSCGYVFKIHLNIACCSLILNIPPSSQLPLFLDFPLVLTYKRFIDLPPMDTSFFYLGCLMIPALRRDIWCHLWPRFF